MMTVKYLDLQRISASFEPSLSQAIKKVIDKGWFLYGEETHGFESDFASFCGARYCLSVANGLDALTLILKSYKDLLGWNDGDEVIAPAFTFIASIEAINRAGLRPVLCDVSENDYLLDVQLLERCVTSRTRALMPVHLYGRSCSMNQIKEVANRYGLKIVEDAAQAHGACYYGERVGHIGNAAGFSFYPAKNLGALGDAGAIITDDEALILHAQMLANYGMRQKYVHDAKGLNSRMDELQAAVLRIKLQRLDDDNHCRQQIARRYLKEIHNPFVTLPYQNAEKEWESVYHVFPVFCRHRDKLQFFLEKKGISTQIHYPIAPHRQVAYRELANQSFPVAELLADTELSLPLHQKLTEEEVSYVINCVNEYVDA